MADTITSTHEKILLFYLNITHIRKFHSKYLIFMRI